MTVKTKIKNWQTLNCEVESFKNWQPFIFVMEQSGFWTDKPGMTSSPLQRAEVAGIRYYRCEWSRGGFSATTNKTMLKNIMRKRKAICWKNSQVSSFCFKGFSQNDDTVDRICLMWNCMEIFKKVSKTNLAISKSIKSKKTKEVFVLRTIKTTFQSC